MMRVWLFFVFVLVSLIRKRASYPLLGTDEDIQLLKGESIERECKGSSPLHWYFQSLLTKKTVEMASENIKEEKSHSTILIRNVDSEDSGIYFCTSGISPKILTLFYVRVRGIPRVQIRNNERRYNYGKFYTISCEIWSYPVPNVRWSVADCSKEISCSNQYYNVDPHSTNIETKVDSRNVFHLSNFTFNANFPRSFQCSATNTYGSAKDEITIEIKDPPTIQIHKPQTEYEYGKQYTLSCSSRSITKPSIEWQWSPCNPKCSKHFERISNETPNILLKSNNPYVNFFDFNNIFPYFLNLTFSLITSGIFQCFSRNEFGNASGNVIQIPMSGIPRVQIRNKERIYNYGESYTISCEIWSNPVPKVRWSAADGFKEISWSNQFQNVDPHSTNIETKVDSGNVFHISNFTFNANFPRSFQCSATNTYGSAKDEITIEIKDPPTIQIHKPQTEYEYGKQYTLSCSSRSITKPSIEWQWSPCNPKCSKHFERISNETPNILLKSNNPYVNFFNFNNIFPYFLNLTFSLITSGIFQCFSRNEFGNASGNVIQIPMSGIPRVQIRNKERIYNYGESYTISCEIWSNPVPKVRWSAADCSKEISCSNQFHNVNPLSTNIETKVDSGNLFHISKFTFNANFPRRFQCNATNEYGSAKDEIIIEIKALPKNHNNDSIQSEHIILICILPGILIIIILVIIIYKRKQLKSKKIEKKRIQKPSIEEKELSSQLLEMTHFEDKNDNIPRKMPNLEEHIGHNDHTVRERDLCFLQADKVFPENRINIEDVIGEGDFGLVKRATSIGIQGFFGEPVRTVAVKMLKENCNTEHIGALMQELKIISNMNFHPNIVNFLGAICEDKNTDLKIIYEYCCHGNLLKYIRSYHKQFINLINPFTGEIENENIEIPEDHLGSAIEVRNNMKLEDDYEYPLPISILERNYLDPLVRVEHSKQIPPYPFDTKALLYYGFQVAEGMNFLANQKIIHRDLAARNVLLAQGNIVKICDFGLTRDLPENMYYRQTKPYRVPIKWMAIESIGFWKFTVQSDVWSFGIFLWELFTLGLRPYSNISTLDELYRTLCSGYRMEKPKFATMEIYKIILDCWMTVPENRPKFTELKERLGKYFCKTICLDYEDLTVVLSRLNK